MRGTLKKERNKKKTAIKSVAVDFFNGSTVGKIGKKMPFFALGSKNYNIVKFFLSFKIRLK